MTTGNLIKYTSLRAPSKTDGVVTGITYNGIRNGKSWNGEDDPMWRTKIASGRAAVNLYNSVTYRESKTPLIYDVRNYGQMREMAIFPTPVIFELDSSAWNQQLSIPSLNPQLSMQMLGKIRGIRDKFQGFTILGELRETIQMFRSPFNSLVKRLERFQDNWKRPMLRYRANKRVPSAKHRRERRQLVNDLNDSFLELMFGLMPLIGDVEDIAEACVELNSEPEIVRSFGKARAEANTSVEEHVFGEYFNFKMLYRARVQVNMKYCIGVRRMGSDPNLANRLVKVGGFTTDNIIPAAYELLPWSFLFDYVSNLGDIISAVTTDTSDVVWSSRTTVEERTVELLSWRIYQGELSREHNIYQSPSYSGSKTYVYRTRSLPSVKLDDFTSIFSLELPSLKQVSLGGSAIYKTFFSK